MKKSLCSGNYKKFFGSIDKYGLTIEELISVISENMSLIAEDMTLGKLVVHFLAPSSPLENQREKTGLLSFMKTIQVLKQNRFLKNSSPQAEERFPLKHIL